MADIQQLAAAARDQIEAAATSAELEAARVQHLGRSAPLVLLLRDISSLEPAERAVVGKEGNIARRELEQLCDQRSQQLASKELDERLAREQVDVTLPLLHAPAGTLHPLTQTRRLIEDIFIGMGYRVAGGPEVESGWYNFTALNTPKGHPARSGGDTFYLDVEAPAEAEGVLLRTQTSTVQIRVMQQSTPPIFIVAPGRTYRRDDIDATHSDMFHQCEGMAIAPGLTLADLKGTLQAFCSELFGGELEVRLRTHFFPFTEPSVEVDVSCYLCDGTGRPAEDDTEFDRCRLCRGEGWIEIMGAGMIDPNVFSFVEGYDDPTLTGFAFGMGIERIAMLRHGIPDIRAFYENDLRVLRQFAGRV
jgi:phenylalanyl-tRNA synthetase alpha chain